jgi:hypothetical protein
MKMTICDICNNAIDPEESNSPIQLRVRNILREMREYDGESNADVCVACACNLKNAFSDVVEKWQKSEGKYE